MSKRRLSLLDLQTIQRLEHETSDRRVGKYLIYSKPNQRQRWGDHQVHPVTNYGDLFFDLFYVAAAYNLGTIIRESPSTEGLLYFVACAFAVYQMWFDKLLYNTRFFTYDDAVHRLFEILVLCALAGVVVHIRPVAILSTPNENLEPFLLSLSLLVGCFLSMCRYLEMLIAGCAGQPAAIVSARRDLFCKIPPFSCYLAASIYCGLQYYGRSDSSSPSQVEQHDDDHRLLAGDDSSYYKQDDTMIYIILASGLAVVVVYAAWIFSLPKDHKKVSVPMNIEFTIHRYGEWTMLVLGEAILSLLIVDVAAGFEYYATFYFGLLSIILLQYMHFRSQPSHADDHAMRKDRNRGFIFGILMQIYSAALLILGVSYKMLLYEYEYEYLGQARRRRSLVFAELSRFLAGGGGALAIPTDERRQSISNFFCASFALVFFCSDAMILVHRGFKDNVGRCRCPESKKTKLKGIVLILCRMGIIIFMATLSLYMKEPWILAMIGFLSIIAQVILRVVAAKVFQDAERIHTVPDLKARQEEEEEREEALPTQ